MASDSIQCQVDELTSAVQGVLKNYNKAIVEGTKEESKKSMDELVKTTKATAPIGKKRRKHYKNSITSRLERDDSLGAEYVWYVKGKDYRLSHLLENGHAKKNGKGRVAGTKFISNAVNTIIPKYVSAIERIIQK